MMTVMGWQMHVQPRADAFNGPNAWSLANYPMQANGSEMMRVALIQATERGVQVCAPVHNTLLIKSSIDVIGNAVAQCQRAMGDASELILKGFRLNCDAEVVRYPERYFDKRGEAMWSKIHKFLN